MTAPPVRHFVVTVALEQTLIISSESVASAEVTRLQYVTEGYILLCIYSTICSACYLVFGVQI